MSVDAEVTAAQGRVSGQSKVVRSLLAAGADSAEAERALFRELDGLTLLRQRQQMLHDMRRQSFESQAAA